MTGVETAECILKLRKIPVMEYLWIFVCFAAVHTCCRGEAGKEAALRIAPVTEPHVLSEGPHWDITSQVLYFVDIISQKILCLNPATGKVTEAYIKIGPVSVVVPVAGRPNTFLAGSATDLIEVEWDPSANDTNPRIKVLSTVDKDRNYTRLNDGKVDPAGRFWAGTMGQKGAEVIDGIASLYRFAADGTPTRMISHVSISNGLCWSHDNATFYYIDSPTLQIVAYDFDVTSGDISNKRVIFRLQPINPGEVPDGMTIDKVGHLWVAINGGARVIQVDPTSGEQLRAVTFPVLQISSVAFGGPDLDILYVTSGRERLTCHEIRDQPLAGSVFAVHGLDVVGAPMLNVKM